MRFDLKKNIVLTGFMGTGKSFTGRILAGKLGVKFIDTDTVIEKKTGLLIRQIFDELGEPGFREIERETIKEVSAENGAVIAVGGGALVNPDNFADLKRNGVVICLTASPEVILSRVERNSDRPLLQVEDKIGKITDLLKSRASSYDKADIKVDTDNKTPEAVADEILRLLNYK